MRLLKMIRCMLFGHKTDTTLTGKDFLFHITMTEQSGKVHMHKVCACAKCKQLFIGDK